MEVTVGNVTYRLSEDDCLAMRLNEPTAFHNRSRKAARYIVVLATQPSCVHRGYEDSTGPHTEGDLLHGCDGRMS